MLNDKISSSRKDLYHLNVYAIYKDALTFLVSPKEKKKTKFFGIIVVPLAQALL